MKLIVKSIFRDKTNHVMVYEAGTILEVKDKERADDLVKRGLCAAYRGGKAPTVTLGKKVPDGNPGESPAADGAETPASGGEESSADGAEAPTP